MPKQKKIDNDAGQGDLGEQLLRDMRLVNSVGLRYFVGVARAGSIRRAADQLHVAASAISRQIQLLEDDVGAPLFKRHPGQKSMTLTAEGEILLRYARAVATGLDQVRADIQSVHTLQRGTVRLGISESFTREFLPMLLHRFHMEYPGITFEIVVAGGPKLMDALANDHLDLTLSYIAPEIFEVSIVGQAILKPCVLVSSSHPFARRSSVDIKELANQELALPDDTLTIRGSYVRMMSKAKIKPRGVVVTNSFELMRSLAATGMCIAISNPAFGGPKAPEGMRYVPLTGSSVELWPLNICVHADRPLPAAPGIFLEHLQAAIKEVAEAA